MQPFVGLPAAGWRGRLSDDEDADETLSRRQLAKLAMLQREKALLGILGPCLIGTTVLTRSPAPPLGPAYDRHGRALKWSLWSPTKGVLIDIFRRSIPAMTEMEDRKAFAAANGLRYGVVEPGRRLSLEMLKEWLNGR